MSLIHLYRLRLIAVKITQLIKIALFKLVQLFKTLQKQYNHKLSHKKLSNL
jgi:hypothetical protein